MEQLLEKLKSAITKCTLQTNFTFVAVFIGIFEGFTDMLEHHVQEFFCSEIEFGENCMKFKKSDRYRVLIENRKVDDSGNKDPLKAIFLWLVDSNAITANDYETFLNLKKQRNILVHEMISKIWEGLTESDIKLLFDMYSLFEKIDQWWINEIEMATNWEPVTDYNSEGVASVSLMYYKMILNVLYGERSEEYLKVLHDLSGA